MGSRHFLLLASLGLVASSSSVTAGIPEPSEKLVYVVPAATQRIAHSPFDHILTFAIPVQIPGASLVPGSYIFRFVTPSTLQVMTAERTRVYSTFFTMRAEGAGFGDPDRERMKLADMEDGPPRIVGWYMPGSIGYEFVYPRRR